MKKRLLGLLHGPAPLLYPHGNEADQGQPLENKIQKINK